MQNTVGYENILGLVGSTPQRHPSHWTNMLGGIRVTYSGGMTEQGKHAGTNDGEVTGAYGLANSAVNVTISPARLSCEPTGATLSSLESPGPPPVTVIV